MEYETGAMMGQGRMIKKLLGQPVHDNKSDAQLSFETRVDKSYLRPNTSQTASYPIGAPLTCLDASSTGNFAVVAGEKVFKVLKIDGNKIAEETDLRAAILNQGNGHNEPIATFRDKLNMECARWMHGNMHSTILAASANGKLALYDVNRLGSEIEVGRIKEHDRKIHNIAVNPNRYQQFLTACQDGTARLFDINESDLGRGKVFYKKNAYRASGDAIRDIKWSPTRGFDFAVATSSGSVQLWDRRQENMPILDLKTAHRGPCTSISWHADGNHIISAGQDQRCHVWDLSRSGERRQAPKWSISTPAPVLRVSWRPPCWSSTANAKRAAQVAVAYDDRGAQTTKISTVHIWDLARPSLPFKEICDFETSPSGLVWHDRDLLWSVNRSGMFEQTDVAFAPKVIDRRALSTFDFSPSGDVLMLLEERRGRQRSLSPDAAEHGIHTREKVSSGQSQSSSGGGPSKGSRSDSDSDVVGSFLGGSGVRSKRGARRQSQSNRSINSLSTTPPSINGTADTDLMCLADAVQITGSYKPQQTMALGHTPSTARRDVYRYLSAQYMEAIYHAKHELTALTAGGKTSSSLVAIVLEQFAHAAQLVGQYRLAQTWKMLAYTMTLLLDRRAEYHRTARLAQRKGDAEPKNRYEKIDDQQPSKGCLLQDDTPKKDQRPKSPLDGFRHAAVRSIRAEEFESTSNMTTPVARPVRDSTLLDRGTGLLTSIDDDQLSLPPAAHSGSFSPKVMPDLPSPDEMNSSSDGYDFYDMDAINTQAIDITAAPPRRTPLRLEYDESQRQEERFGTLGRHDSAESFEMFSTSADSLRARLPARFSESATKDGSGGVSISHESVPEADSSWDSSGESRVYRSYASQDSNNLQAISAQVPRLVVNESTETVNVELESDEQALINAALADARAEAESAVDESNPALIDSDYLPQANDPLFVPSPIDPHVLVQRTLQFEVRTGVLNAAAMILALKPYLHPGTVDDLQSAAVLQQYHHRLSSMELHHEAALLRKLAYPEYRSTYSQGLYNITIGFLCLVCNAPLGDDNPTMCSDRLQKCRKCATYNDGCAICQMFEPHDQGSFDLDEYYARSNTTSSIINSDWSSSKFLAADRFTAGLWWYCQGCGHGGHAKCMLEWHGEPSAPGPSDGCCPVEGCLHPCLPGAYRAEYFKERELQSSSQTGRIAKENLREVRAGAAIKKDERNVGESRAVESVRGSLSVGSSNGVGVGTSSSASLERKKSVKVVAPGEERRR